VLSVSLSD
jgi:coupling of ubiquitin conjugation to ER degradation protein 1